MSDHVQSVVHHLRVLVLRCKRGALPTIGDMLLVNGCSASESGQMPSLRVINDLSQGRETRIRDILDTGRADGQTLRAERADMRDQL